MNKKIALPVTLVLCIAIGLIFAVGCACVDVDTSNSTQAPIPAPASEPASAPKTTPNVIQQKAEDMESIMAEAKRIGVHVQSLSHKGDSITIACQADSYTAFRDYLAALDESGRFSFVTSPAEVYPYIKGGSIAITLEPKFQMDISGVYYKVNRALAPMTDSAAIAMLVSIAEESSINVDAESAKFRVPAATLSTVKVGATKYKVMSFKNIQVQGNYDNVMAFISALDSGTTLETMVLTLVTIVDGFEVDGKIETRATVDVDIYSKSY